MEGCNAYLIHSRVCCAVLLMLTTDYPRHIMIFLLPESVVTIKESVLYDGTALRHMWTTLLWSCLFSVHHVGNFEIILDLLLV